jgi:hypothetical protein
MRHVLSAQEIVHIWEMALRLHPVDRALTILAVAYPEVPRETLLALSVGQRDGYLLALRQYTFGSQVAGYAECPICQERLEFACEVADLRVAPLNTRALMEPAPRQTCECAVGGYRLCFRLPDSRDLAALAQCQDVSAARMLLTQRCVISAAHDGQQVAAVTLPEAAITALAERMAECDPQAEVQLALTCPACHQEWTLLFDVVTFFWTEICVQAKRLMREVHRLARVYGWREADILSMSASRRQFYLEMVP